MQEVSEQCHFCEIVAKERESFIVYEDADFLAFLDYKPVFFGHTLLIPKKHYQTLYDVPDDLAATYLIKTKLMGKAVERGMEAEGSFLAFNNHVSQSVPHVHVHIIPRKFKDGLKGFFWPRNKYDHLAQMAEVQAKIKKYIK